MEIRTESVQIPAGQAKIPAHLARPAGEGPFPGVIVVMEAFGLNGHIKGVAERIAREGYVAVAPDLYYRESDRLASYSDLPKAIGLMQKLRDPDILGDVSATLDFLKGQKGVRAEKIGITGFCMGGRISFLTACNLPVQAAVPFYGGGIGGLLDQADRIKAPLLVFFGEKDGFIPLSEVERVKSRLSELEKEAEVIVYPGADHGFFCDERPSFQEDAASDSWRRLLAFFAKHLGR